MRGVQRGERFGIFPLWPVLCLLSCRNKKVGRRRHASVSRKRKRSAGHRGRCSCRYATSSVACGDTFPSRGRLCGRSMSAPTELSERWEALPLAGGIQTAPWQKTRAGWISVPTRPGFVFSSSENLKMLQFFVFRCFRSPPPCGRLYGQRHEARARATSAFPKTLLPSAPGSLIHSPCGAWSRRFHRRPRSWFSSTRSRWPCRRTARSAPWPPPG